MVELTFQPVRTTQAAAEFLRLAGGSLDKYILIKLLYLLDRESLRLWNDSLTGDKAYLMEHGPVLSRVYDLTKGESVIHRGYWEKFVSNADGETNQVSLIDDPGRDELSAKQLQLIERVFDQFGKFTWRQMRDYCHNLPEFAEVGKSSKPIPIDRLLTAVGKSPKEIERFFIDQQESRLLAELLEP